MPCAADLVIEKLDRDLHMNTRAIAGFAIRIYKRLFDPDFGSIVDLV